MGFRNFPEANFGQFSVQYSNFGNIKLEKDWFLNNWRKSITRFSFPVSHTLHQVNYVSFTLSLITKSGGRNLKINESILIFHKFYFIFLCLIRFTFTDTENLQGCRRRDRAILISLFHFHPFTNILTFISSRESGVSKSYFNASERSYQTVFQWKNPHLGKKVFDWMLFLYYLLLYKMLLIFHLKRWIWTPIAFYSSITNTTANQTSQHRTRMFY